MANTTYFVKGNRVVDSNGDAVVIINGNELVTTDKFPSGGGGDIPPEIEEDIERALLGNHVYSTTERVSGEWIDGRNIYERTYTLENTETLSSGSLGRFVALEDIGLVASDIVDAKFYGTNSITSGTVEIDTSYLWVDAITAISCHTFTLNYLKDE